MPQNIPVPILMYHVIADPPAAGTPFPELWVSPRDFAGQMRWLKLAGFHPVTMRAVWDHWSRGVSIPKRAIVVSFDDGYRSHVKAAMPILAQRGWPGILNLKVGTLGPEGLRARGVRRLIAAGWEIDAHTITHPDLTTLDDEQLEYEVAGSRRAIRRMFGVPADFFCYPSGAYDERVIAAVQRAGFLGATTTEFGLARRSEPFSLDRVRVNRSDGVAGFAAKLKALVPGSSVGP